MVDATPPGPEKAPDPPANLRQTLRQLVLLQVVGMLCLIGGVIWIMVVVSHNASEAVQLCTGTDCGRESYVLPIILAVVGYVVSITGFVTWRRRAIKFFGTASLGRRRRRPMPLPGMPGSPGGPPQFPGGLPPGTPGSLGGPPQFPGGLPPGTPGSPSGPP